MESNKLRRFLIFGFSSLVIAVIALSMKGVFSLYKTNTYLKETYNKTFSALAQSDDLQSDLLILRSVMKDVALSRNSEQLNLAISEAENYNSHINDHFAELLKNYNSNSYLNEVITAYNDWTPIRNNTIEFAKSGQYEKAAENTRTYGAEQVALIEEKMNGFIGYIRTENEKSLQLSNEIIKDLLNHVFGYTFFVILFIGIVSYFIKRRIAEYEVLLFEENEKINITYNSIADGIVSINTDRNIEKLNKIVENITGWKSEEVIGKPFSEIFSLTNGATKEKLKDPVEKVLTSDKSYQIGKNTVLTAKDGTKVYIEGSAAPIKDKEGVTSGVVIVFRDITERVEKEKSLIESEAIQRDYKFQDLIDIDQLKKMLLDFYKITGCPLTILDNDSNPIVITYQEDICTNFHKANPTTLKHCHESDRYLSTCANKGKDAVMYNCPRGLIDAAAPIIVEGNHLANLFVGQFLTEKPDVEFYKKQAKEFGYDEAEYLKALSKVSILSKDRANENLKFLKFIVEFIANMGLAKLKEINAVTRIVRAEEEISKREQYRLITENSSDMISLLSPEGVFIYISPSCAKISGYQVSEIIDHSIREFIHPDDIVLFENVSKNLNSHISKTYTLTLRFKKKDGSYIWTESNGWAIIDEETGELKEIQSSIRDISERRKLDEALVANEAKQKSMIANISDVITILDKNGVIQYVSPNIEKLFGWTPEEIVGTNSNATVHQDDSMRIKKELAKCMKNADSVITVEFKYKCKDGSYKDVELTASNLIDDPGIGGILMNYHDVSERKKSQEEILYNSYHDSLTGLYNRRMLEEYLNRISEPDLNRETISIIMGDINGLKLINDAFGHENGDIVIKRIATIMNEECGDKGIVARTGGDEFAAVLKGVSYEEASQIISEVKRRCEIDSQGDLLLSVSLGVANNAEEKQNLTQCYHIAEDRMYTSKLLEGRSIKSAVLTNLRTVLEERTGETTHHCERMAEMAQVIGPELELHSFEVENLKLLALMHDIGKSAIPDNILLKTGKLDEEEMQTMKKHCEIGFRIASTMSELSPIAESILHHHEKWDGTGYPYGLKGEEIPKLSRIVSIIDAFDAMTHNRPYRKALSQKEAVEELLKRSGTQFDPDIVKVFIEKFVMIKV